MVASAVPVANNTPPAPTQPAPVRRAGTDEHGFSFSALLSMMNPLQYLPVIGTIYRAVTGDVIPEVVRRAGSLVVSGVLGGPVGVAMNVAMTLAEKITDIDPERIVAASLNLGASVSAGPAEPRTAEPAAARPAWTRQQLTAYGVATDRQGNLSLGDVKGADVLNMLELSRIRGAAAAYGAGQAVPVPGGH